MSQAWEAPSVCKLDRPDLEESGENVRVERLPSKGPNSPFSPGTRTVLARTCRKCGELADGDSFPVLSGTGARRHVCHRCQNRQKKQDREDRGIGRPLPRPPEDKQTNKRRQWSAEDDRHLREQITAGTGYEQIALELGRSLQSVYTRRRILGLAAVRTRHRVAKPWQVRRP